MPLENLSLFLLANFAVVAAIAAVFYRVKLNGRRQERDRSRDELAIAKAKIEELNRLIKDPKTSVEDRKKYRN